MLTVAVTRERKYRRDSSKLGCQQMAKSGGKRGKNLWAAGKELPTKEWIALFYIPGGTGFLWERCPVIAEPLSTEVKEQKYLLLS